MAAIERIAKASAQALEQRDDQSRTPLQLAQSRGYGAMVQMLMQAGVR